jgi:hypothetical protein
MQHGPWCEAEGNIDATPGSGEMDSRSHPRFRTRGLMPLATCDAGGLRGRGLNRHRPIFTYAEHESRRITDAQRHVEHRQTAAEDGAKADVHRRENPKDVVFKTTPTIPPLRFRCQRRLGRGPNTGAAVGLARAVRYDEGMRPTTGRIVCSLILSLIGICGTIFIVSTTNHLNACTSETMFTLLPLGAGCGAMLGSSVGSLLSRSTAGTATFSVAGAVGFWPAILLGFKLLGF